MKSESRVLRLKGPRPGYLIQYPFGVVAITDDRLSDSPLDNEQLFPDVQTALRLMRVRRRDCVPAKRLPERPYRVVVTHAQSTSRSAGLYSYIAACIYIDRVEWAVRMDHGLRLPCDLRVEDSRSGIVEPPRMMSELGVVKALVHPVPAAAGRPDYVLRLPVGAASIWSGPAFQEELWMDPQLMLRQYGLHDWPEPVEAHALPKYAVVRPDSQAFLVVAEPYHSLLHAGRIAGSLREASGLRCLVHDGREVHGFDDTIRSGDVVRMTADSIDTFTVKVQAGVVTLVPTRRCVAMPLLRPRPDLSAN